MPSFRGRAFLRRKETVLDSQVDKDREAKSVRDLFVRMHPGWTDEDLLNRPSENEHFCNVARVKIRSDMDDHTITKHLMGRRKKGVQPYGKPRGGVRLELELQAWGITLSREEFRERITELFHGLYRAVTPEEMLRRPSEGKAFCEAVRKNLKVSGIPERLICQTLSNLRREGAIKRPRQAVA